MPTGRTPAIRSSVSDDRFCSSRSAAARQGAVPLVDPAVDADLVACPHHPALLVGVQGGDHRRDEEGGRDVKPIEQRQDAGNALPVPYCPWESLPGELSPSRSVPLS